MFEVEQKFRLADPGNFLETLSFMGLHWEKKVVEIDTYFQHPSRDFVQTDEALRIRRHLTFLGSESGVLPERAEAEVLVTFKGPKLDSAAKIRKELELPLSIAAQLPPERFSGVSIFPDVSADFSSAEFRGVCPPCDSNESSFSGVSSPRDLWGLLDTLDETSSYFSWKELLELLGFSAVHDVRKVRSKAYWEWEGCRVEISFDQIAGLGTYAELEFIARDKSEIPAVRGRLLALSEFLRLTDIEPRSYLALVIEAEK